MPKSAIDRGINHPYDNRELPNTPARKAVLGILADLTDRRGIRQELESVDDDIRAEMVDSLTGIVNTAYERTYTVPLMETEETRPVTPSWKLATDVFSVVVDDLGINLLKYADHVPTVTVDALQALLAKRLGPAFDVRNVMTDQMKNGDIWEMAKDIFTATFINMPTGTLDGLGDEKAEDVTESIYWAIIQHLGKGPYTPSAVKQLNHMHSIAVTDDVGYSVAYAPTVQQFTVQTMGQTLSHNATTSDSLFDAVKQASGKLG